MEDYLVSIIVPVYNVEEYIKKCIDSCVNQTYLNIEVIAVDDGSTDLSSAILDELKEEYDKLKVIHKKNSGVSSSRNIGLKEAKGKYIVFVDADDYLSEECIEYMMNIINSTSSEFAIIKNCFTSINQEQNEDMIYSIDREQAVCLLLGLSVQLGCWNKIYSKELLEKNKIFFDENLFYGEGLKFIFDVAMVSNKIGVGTKRVYYYRKNNLLSATSKFDYEKYKNGESVLLSIKEELINESEKVKNIWMFHYAMFAQNVLISSINNKNSINNFRRLYKEWKHKFNKYFYKLIFSKYITKKEKIKLVIIKICPVLFAVIRKNKIKRIVKESV